ncbi:S41 family peptidase [Raoultibacter phocaeensis]|uniref:S41 family peptidase n=1 Tax=Raoultibacter phocaeensis TaxID=2479841 RepID=UPI00111B6373|nr:S41 family peptidase [Raoultibacter phocaeensis]
MANHSETNKLKAASARNARIVKILAVCICVCLAFAAGFLLRGDQGILKRIGFESLIVAGEQNPGATVRGDTYSSISARVAEVEGILSNDSMDSYNLDEATSGILASFAEATEDPYLRYYDETRYQAFIKENASKYGGIGVLFSERNGRAYAVDVFEGSTADANGVKAGDFIVAIDGDRSQEWSANEVINALSRDEGDSVVVTWRRPATADAEGGDEFSTTLTTAVYQEPNVTTSLEDDQVGYISLKQFTQNSAALVGDAVAELEEQGALSFVLDIRSNPGGYLTQAVDVASLFMKSGVVVEIETVRDGVSTKSVGSSTTATDKPLVVLVNGDTSAAAEVVAGALQDSQRATIVGTKTMGKGSVQRVQKLSFGGALRYTAAYYRTPLGYDINNAGISPDITVNDDGEEDNQKQFALETALSLIEL